MKLHRRVFCQRARNALVSLVRSTSTLLCPFVNVDFHEAKKFLPKAKRRHSVGRNRCHTIHREYFTSWKSTLLPNLQVSFNKSKSSVETFPFAKMMLFLFRESLIPSHNLNKRKAHGKNRRLNHPDNSISIIMDAVAKINDVDITHYTSCPPQTTSLACNVDVKTFQGSIFVAGRYNKYSRVLSQTPWFIEGVRKTDTSVQELICEKIQQAVDASGQRNQSIARSLIQHSSPDLKFLSSGREDVDVKMLGTALFMYPIISAHPKVSAHPKESRPFATELIDPKKLSMTQADMIQLQRDINASTELIAIRDLQIVNRDGLTKLKEGEEEKTKTYSAKIWCPVPIPDDNITKLNTMKNIMLAQKTPLRVLHRRSIGTRNRLVHELCMTRFDNEHYSLVMKTEAGTYIKEFVHSDFGRTEPSMCSLLDAPIDILELDVEAVELNWPPKIEDC